MKATLISILVLLSMKSYGTILRSDVEPVITCQSSVEDSDTVYTVAVAPGRKAATVTVTTEGQEPATVSLACATPSSEDSKSVVLECVKRRGFDSATSVTFEYKGRGRTRQLVAVLGATRISGFHEIADLACEVASK